MKQILIKLASLGLLLSVVSTYACVVEDSQARPDYIERIESKRVPAIGEEKPCLNWVCKKSYEKDGLYFCNLWSCAN